MWCSGATAATRPRLCGGCGAARPHGGLSRDKSEETPPSPQRPEGAVERAVGTSAQSNSDCFNEFPLACRCAKMLWKVWRQNLINAPDLPKKKKVLNYFIYESGERGGVFFFLCFFLFLLGDAETRLGENSLVWVIISAVKAVQVFVRLCVSARRVSLELSFSKTAQRSKLFFFFFYHVLFKITASSCSSF